MEPSTLRRNVERGSYDIGSAKAVFDDCFIAHVSYVDKGLPQCLPMIALVKEEEDESDNEDDSLNKTDERAANGIEKPLRNHVVYLHGHPSARVMELVRQANQQKDDVPGSSTGAQADTKEPVKVCITATKVDGLVLSSAPNGHSLNYRSAVIHGMCTPVKSKTVKRKVLHDVTNHIVQNRWEEVNPVASFQVSLVYVVKVSIDSLSVKTRTGPPSIQPRDREKDGADNAIPPWTGVVPLWEQLGEPTESGLTPGAKVSENLRDYVDRRSERHRSYSERAARN